MPDNKEPEMRLPSPGRRSGFGSREPGGRGRRRTVDVDKNKAYRSTSINMSSSFKKRLKMAADIEEVSITEFMIVRAKPDVDAILAARGLADYGLDD